MRRCCLLILLLVILLPGCGGKSQRSTPSEPNDNATEIELPPDLAAFFKENEIEGLEFWILQNVTEYDFSDYTRDVYELGSRGAYYGKRYEITPTGKMDFTTPLIEYSLNGWPDLSDKQVYITRIWITDPDVKIYGLSIDNTMAEWQGGLTDKGYSFGGHHDDYSADMIADSPDGTYIICYNSDPRSLMIIAPTTNREMIDFD